MDYGGDIGKLLGIDRVGGSIRAVAAQSALVDDAPIWKCSEMMARFFTASILVNGTGGLAWPLGLLRMKAWNRIDSDLESTGQRTMEVAPGFGLASFGARSGL